MNIVLTELVMTSLQSRSFEMLLENFWRWCCNLRVGPSTVPCSTPRGSWWSMQPGNSPLQFHSEPCWLDGVEEHDPHSSPSVLQVWTTSVQQVEDSVFHTNAWSVCRLEELQLTVQGGGSGWSSPWSSSDERWKCFSSLGCGVLRTGAMQDVFHTSRTLSILRLRFKMCRKSPQSWCGQSWSSLELMSSGPRPFIVLIFLSSLPLTWFIVIRRGGLWACLQLDTLEAGKKSLSLVCWLKDSRLILISIWLDLKWTLFLKPCFFCFSLSYVWWSKQLMQVSSNTDNFLSSSTVRKTAAPLLSVKELKMCNYEELRAVNHVQTG